MVPGKTPASHLMSLDGVDALLTAESCVIRWVSFLVHDGITLPFFGVSFRDTWTWILKNVPKIAKSTK